LIILKKKQHCQQDSRYML